MVVTVVVSGGVVSVLVLVTVSSVCVVVLVVTVVTSVDVVTVVVVGVFVFVSVLVTKTFSVGGSEAISAQRNAQAGGQRRERDQGDAGAAVEPAATAAVVVGRGLVGSGPVGGEPPLRAGRRGVGSAHRGDGRGGRVSASGRPGRERSGRGAHCELTRVCFGPWGTRGSAGSPTRLRSQSA